MPPGGSSPTLLVEEANKLAFAQSLEVQTHHQVQGLLEIKGHPSLTEATLLRTRLCSLTAQS